MEKNTKNVKETTAFGIAFAKKLKGGDILCLEGDLGAGKTALTKGIALGLGIKKEILSPTFSLMNVYTIAKNKQLVHIDTYRLKNEEELIDIGAMDYIGAPNTICIIEWPDKIKNLLKKNKTILVKIEHLEGDKRKIKIN